VGDSAGREGPLLEFALAHGRGGYWKISLKRALTSPSDFSIAA
jgi:hypothetical protein